MKLDEFFRCVGGGYGEAKARFQNDERIVRFLNMFPGDDTQSMARGISRLSQLRREATFLPGERLSRRWAKGWTRRPLWLRG